MVSTRSSLIRPSPSASIGRLQLLHGVQSKIGGKGTVRRKKKTVHKASQMDDKRLQSTLKRLGVNNIPGIEEVSGRAIAGFDPLHVC